jgi:hypothetical protein
MEESFNEEHTDIGTWRPVLSEMEDEQMVQTAGQPAENREAYPVQDIQSAMAKVEQISQVISGIETNLSSVLKPLPPQQSTASDVTADEKPKSQRSQLIEIIGLLDKELVVLLDKASGIRERIDL